MNDQELRARQAPLKDQYRADPASALATLRVTGTLDFDRVACLIETGHGPLVAAGLHPRTGGDGTFKCSADMLLEALIGCAGVTLCAVATAMKLPITAGTITAEGDLDFRGTLGVARDVPIGFLAIRILIDLQTTAADDQLTKLAQLTERYCVVAQSLNVHPVVTCRRR